MHPRTPLVLSDLVGIAETLIRDGKPSAMLSKLQRAQILLDDITALRDKPSESGEHLIDDATIWLATAVRNAERGYVGSEPTKWITLAGCLLPWVKTDLAVSIEKKYGIPPARLPR